MGDRENQAIWGNCKELLGERLGGGRKGGEREKESEREREGREREAKW